MTIALGIDIGGTGIKGALVDTATGKLATDRLKLFTPKGGDPDDVVAVTLQLIERLGGVPEGAPVGICVPAVVKGGTTLTAANISKKWIGLDAKGAFEQAIGREITILNDADAAGYAELHFGAAKDVPGLVFLTTLGTGIGTAPIYDGVLLPNTELGRIELDGEIAETRASYGAMERDDLDWKHWAKRLDRYYGYLESLFFPDLFIVGGGVSKNASEFLPLLTIRTPIVPAVHRNNSGILGAAALAAANAGAARRG